MIALKKLPTLITMSVIALSALTRFAHAADYRTATVPPLGVGFQYTFPFWGLSAIYDFTDRASAQAVTSFGIISTPLFVKGIYRLTNSSHWVEFGRNPEMRLKWNAYTFGGFGWVRLPSLVIRQNALKWSSRYTLGTSFGAGIEYNAGDLVEFLNELTQWLPGEGGSANPNTYINIELGYSISDAIVGDSSWFLGIGSHYRF